jgi:hypothetical protein
VEEVCPPEAAAAGSQEPDRFELVAGERGIAAGEEITISYGSWPSGAGCCCCVRRLASGVQVICNTWRDAASKPLWCLASIPKRCCTADVFLLFFGFVPASNPHDSGGVHTVWLVPLDWRPHKQHSQKHSKCRAAGKRSVVWLASLPPAAHSFRSASCWPWSELQPCCSTTFSICPPSTKG